MDEALKIKIIADTSGVKNEVGKLKKDLGGIGSDAKGIGKEIKGAFSKAFNKIPGFSEMKSTVNGITSSFKGLSAGASTAVAALGGFAAGIGILVAGAVKIKSICDEVSKLGDEIEKTSQTLRMSYQDYQEWDYIMGLAGGSAKDLTSATTIMTKKMGEAANGTESAKAAFDKLGVAVTDSNGQIRNSSDVFNEAVIALQGITNETERAIYAQELFGKGAANLAPLLNMSAEEMQNARHAARTLGLTMTDNAVKVSATYNDMAYTLKQAAKSFKYTIGEAFMPVITSIVKGVVKALAYISAFVRALFGLKQNFGSLGGGSSSSGGSVNKAAKSMGNYGSSVDKATKAVKELKKQTAKFDELNILQTKADSSGSAGTGGIGGIGDIGDLDIDTGGIGEFSSLFSEAELDKIDKFKKKMDEIRGWLPQVASIVTILTGIVMVVIGCCTGNLVLIAAGVGVAGLGIAIGLSKDENGESVFSKMFKNSKALWNDIKNWFKQTVAPVFTKDWWVQKWQKLHDAIDERLTPIKDRIRDRWQSIKDWFSEHVKPVFTVKYWKDKLETIRTATHEKLTEVKEKMRDRWQAVKEWFGENVKPKFTVKYWNEKWNTLKQSATEKLNELKTKISESWGKIKSWYQTSVGKYFTSDFWSGKFSSIKNGMRNSLNGVISIVESAVNRIIAKINTLRWNIPTWVPVVGGKTFGFNFKYVSIPRLATGGIATHSTLANIGEAGKEAVLPLERNTEWMDMLADRIAARNGTPAKIILTIDGKQLGYAAIDNINAITKQTGSLQLQIA